MEEIEVPLDKIQEDLNHHASPHGGGSGASWITWAALLSAFLAVFAAIAALLAGKHANEAMMDQIQASDRWAYYQAKSIKSSVLETRSAVIQAMGKSPGPEIGAKIAGYQKDQAELQTQAKEREESSARHFESHETFARAVTLYQIAIAITAISVLARRRKFLWVAVSFGIVGTAFLLIGLLHP